MFEHERKLNDWLNYRGAVTSQRELVALLNVPMSRQDARLFELVEVRCLKGFVVGPGEQASPGETVKLPRHVAESLIAGKRAELV